MLHILSVSVQSLLNTTPNNWFPSYLKKISVALALYLFLCHKIDKDKISIHFKGPGNLVCLIILKIIIQVEVLILGSVRLI